MDLIPPSSYSLMENIDGVVLESVRNSFKLLDLIYPIGLIFLIALFALKFHRICNDKLSIKIRLVVTAITLVWIGVSYNYRDVNPSTIKEHLHHRTLSNYECAPKTKQLQTFGILPFAIETIYDGCKSVPSLSAQQKNDIDQTLAQMINDNGVSVLDFSKNKTKNLILIIVESLNSWSLDFKMNGKNILPNLKEIMSSGDAIVATNLISQAGPGRSSDGQLIINTGLFPLRGEATVARYCSNEFPSIAKAINDGRPKFEVISENKYFWRHSVTSQKEGYDEIYDADTAIENGLMEGRRDETMFSLAEIMLAKTQQPFFCTLITISMHGPYKGEPKWRSWISDASLPHDLTTYLEATHYFDQELGKFIEFLKEKGIYDNSVIVITADHESKVPGYEGPGIGTVPFIALNAGLDTIIPRRGGQIDIFPTILEITGHSGYEWGGFGRSLLSPAPDGAITPQGKIHGNLSDREAEQCRKLWDVSELVIKHNYLKGRLSK